MKQEKIIRKVVSIVIAIILLMNLTTVAYSVGLEQSPQGIYLVSESVPQAVTKYAQNSVGKMISDIAAVSQITISKPFKIKGAIHDVYYFVVYSDGRMVGTYRVFELENGYSGIYSEDTSLLNNIMQLANVTSVNNPARIVVGAYDDMYAIVGKKIYTLIEDTSGNTTSTQILLARNAIGVSESVVNIVDTISVDLSYCFLRTTPTWKYLNLDCLETQSSLPWCMAYATASVMRYKTGYSISSINAAQIMHCAYPEMNLDQLYAMALPISDAISYANRYGIYPSYVGHRRAYSAIAQDIIDDKPVVFICDQPYSTSDTTHAIVCRGYYDNNGNSYYSIWNPWYDYYERIFTNDNIYVPSTGNYTFRWYSTVYGWG